MTLMHRVLTHPLPHRAHVHVALALMRLDVMPRRPLGTPVVLTHLGDALTVALTLILGVVVVHACPPLISSVSFGLRTESAEAGIYACLPKKAITNYIGAFDAIFEHDAKNLRF
jgi:hypothetical protein